MAFTANVFRTCVIIKSNPNIVSAGTEYGFLASQIVKYGNSEIIKVIIP